MDNNGKIKINTLPSGVPDLDQVLGGGFPEYSFNVIAGAPGSGKTTLAHQIVFANASPERPALYFTVLGEPALKMLRYQQNYAFFDPDKVESTIRFINLSDEVLTGDLGSVLERIVREVEACDPSIVVVDSFRTVLRRGGDPVTGEAELQGFVQRLALHLTTWQATTFLVGEYMVEEMRDNPVFTVADGLLWLSQSAERNLRSLPSLTEEQILEWADANFARTGKWPECRSYGLNPVEEAPGETWDKLSSSLMKGQRGLPGGTTLAQLLRDKRGKRFLKGLSPLTKEQILSWADAHFARTGKWPATSSKEAVMDAPSECWNHLSQSLRSGTRGLPGGTSLTLLLEKHCGIRLRSRTTPLTLEQIGLWARAHRARTGTWPRTTSGEVVGGDGTLWAAVDKSLRNGNRSLPGGMNLASLVCSLKAEEVKSSEALCKAA